MTDFITREEQRKIMGSAARGAQIGVGLVLFAMVNGLRADALTLVCTTAFFAVLGSTVGCIIGCADTLSEPESQPAMNR